MRLSSSLFALLFISLTFSNNSQAQLFENFDSGDKASYSPGSATLSTGDWYLEEALLGNLSNDKCNGTQCVRLDRRDGVDTEVFMLFDKEDGANEITFSIANYGSTSGNSVQVQYSTDGGSNWENVGDPIAATSVLEQTTLLVEISGNIRFKFVQSGNERMNLDDVTITDFIEAQETATLAVTVDAASADNEDLLAFPKTLVGTTSDKTIELKNVGNTELVISDIAVVGNAFSVSQLSDDSLNFNESGSFVLTYEPTGAGIDQGSITITSNASNGTTFELTLGGEAFEDGDLIPISEARILPLGTRVSVTGRVTVANEVGGPLYMQDGTAGIAVFWEPMHTVAEIGDSVTITGPLTVFRPIAGSDSDFLLQISNTESDDNIIFEILDVEKRIIEPTPINLTQLNSGEFESQLVVVPGATIDHTGVFGSNQNYDITDIFDTAQLRIDNNTDLVGADTPEGAINIIGAVGKFDAIYQLIPRFAEDLGVEAVVFPGDDVSKDQTLDVVTWNIEWFGDAGNGPSDVDVQFENVKTLVTTIDADIYAFQEISNTTLFDNLDQDLEGYSGVVAAYSQSQKVAYLYKNSTISVNSAEMITQGMEQSDWANGRYPYEIQFTAAINGEQQEFYAYNIHAKAFGEASDYSQRLNASAQLKNYIDNARSDDNVIVLGDFNDEILESTSTGTPDSPYKNFDDDPEYTIVTKSLEEKGLTSYSRFSMIDHILFSSELEDEYFVGTERVENPFYIGSFLSETSDHFPVWVRFQMGMITSNDDEPITKAYGFKLNQNYPNPFNPTTSISYVLDSNADVSLEVFDLMGRKVAILVNGRQMAGEQSVSFDASNLASGVYVYRLSNGNQQITKKMLLLK